MIGTGYSELMVSFNFISRAKPGGSGSACIKESHKNNVGVNIPQLKNCYNDSEPYLITKPSTVSISIIYFAC